MHSHPVGVAGSVDIQVMRTLLHDAHYENSSYSGLQQHRAYKWG